MSGSTEKSTRRELRRAMGKGALQVVQSHQDVIKHQLVPVTNDHQRRIQYCEEAIERNRKHQVDIDSDLHTFMRMTFRDRWRWLFRGVK